MLDTLRRDDVDIQLSLGPNDPDDTRVLQRSRGKRLHFTALANEFLNLTACVTNHSSEYFELFFVSHPASPDILLFVFSAQTMRLTLSVYLWSPPGTPKAHVAHLARYVVMEGVPAVPLRLLQPDEKENVVVPLCVLAEGRYEFGCIAEELDVPVSVRRSFQCRTTLTIKIDR